MNRENQIYKMLLDINSKLDNKGNEAIEEELRELKKLNSTLKGEVTKLKNKLNEVK